MLKAVRSAPFLTARAELQPRELNATGAGERGFNVLHWFRYLRLEGGASDGVANGRKVDA